MDTSDLDKQQIRWQNWRNWFYSEMEAAGRNLTRRGMALDMLPEGQPGEYGTSGSPTVAARARYLNQDQAEYQNAQALYSRAVKTDIAIKAARRAADWTELARLLAEDAESIIAEMNGFFLYAARPEEYKKPNRPGTRPDTSLFLGEERKTWLAENGGIQPTIQRLIDAEMKK